MNSMYKYDHLVDRDLVMELYWHNLLKVCGLDAYGMNSHGKGFENDTFAIRPYNWSDENDPLPNFEYKPTGLKIEWYKYPFRASYMTKPYNREELRWIFGICIESVRMDRYGFQPKDKTRVL